MSVAALATLLIYEVVDQTLRCVNPSVAVTACELEALPLPPPKAMNEIELLVQRRADRETLEQALCRACGWEKG